MAVSSQPLINIGAAINDGTGELGPRAWLQKVNRLPNPDNTVNPLSGDYSGTYEQKITAAVADAAVTGKKYCWITQPYNVAAVTLNTAIRMILEGNDPTVYNVKAYGGVGDGLTIDTASVQAAITGALAVGGTVYAPAGSTFLSNQVLVSGTVKISFGGQGTYKIASTFAKPVSDALFYCTSPVEFQDITIDGNSKGRSGIQISGSLAAGSLVDTNVTVKNITDAADSGATSGVIITAPNCTVRCFFTNLIFTSAQGNPSIPRCVTFDTGSDGSGAFGIRGSTVNVITVIAAPRISCLDVVIDGAVSDGFYCLAASDKVLIDGAQLRNVSNMVVLEGGNATVRNIRHVVDTILSGGLPGINLDFSPGNIILENIRLTCLVQECDLVATRASTGTVAGLIMRNCSYTGVCLNVNSAPIVLSVGTTNNLIVENCYFEQHQATAPTGEQRLVIHTAGNSVIYRNNLWRLVDDEGTVTGTTVYRHTFPALTAPSLYAGNLVLNDPAHPGQCIVDLATAGAQLAVLGDPLEMQANAGYLREFGFNGILAQKRMSSTAAPTSGTFSQGDIVFVTSANPGAVAEFICTTAGTPGIWKPCAAGIATQTLADAATIAVNCNLGTICTMTLITTGRTMGAPTNPFVGQRLAFVIIQDGTGGRTLLWNAIYKVSWSDTGNTLNKRSTVAFIYDGTSWNQDGAQTPYV